MGGSPCSGKSSIARILADQHRLCVYHVDEAFEEHRRRIDPDEHPVLHKWTNTPWNELWMQPVDALLEEAIACYREHFKMVVEDLLLLPASEFVLAEGTCLLPDCVANVLMDRERAIWVVPTEKFQREHYSRRGTWVQGILSQCENPEQAFQNWMDRDAAFAEWVRREARRLGLKLMEIEGKRTIAENAELAAGHLGLTEGRSG